MNGKWYYLSNPFQSILSHPKPIHSWTILFQSDLSHFINLLTISLLRTQTHIRKVNVGVGSTKIGKKNEEMQQPMVKQNVVYVSNKFSYES